MSENKTVGVGFVEGGDYFCPVHDNFRTADRKEWDAHCIENGHTIDGEAPCIYCHKRVLGSFKYPKPGKPVSAVCDECKVSELGLTPEQVEASKLKPSPVQVAQVTGTGGQ